MVPFHIYHGAVTLVFLHRLADAVGGVGLLQQGVANVALIGQDIAHHLIRPALDAAGGGYAVRLQLPLDLCQAAPVQVAAVDAFHHLRLRPHDLRLTVRPPLVAQQLLILEGDVPRLPALLDTPDHVFADGLALRLGKPAEQREQELTGLSQSIDIFLFEDHTDAVGPEHPHHLQGVHRVPGEAGERLGEDQVDFAPFAGGDHLFELHPLLHARAGDAFIGKNTGHFPIGVLIDLLGVVGFLGGVAGELLLAVGGYPAVGGHPLAAARGPSGGRSLFCGGDDVYPPLLLCCLFHAVSFPCLFLPDIETL